MAEAAAEEKTPEVSTSKTIVLVGFGGYDKLKIQQKPKPKAEKGEVVVKVKATGINFAELMARQGFYDRTPKTPCVLGFEAAGVVEELGEEVADLKVGDRVGVMSSFGCWSEFIAVPALGVFPLPDEMSFEDAAALPVNYLTAYLMLHDFGNLRKGKSVLVHMAAGGVGIAATQLCKCVEDVTVFGTCSASKHDVVKEEGVTHPIDYHTQDYAAEIKKISPEGVDIVLDPLGGADSSKGFTLLKPMGKIIHFGAANLVGGPGRSILKAAKHWWDTKNINPMSLMTQNRAVCGFHLGHLDDPQFLRDTMLEIYELYKQGKVKPRIDSVWAFEDVGRAMAQMHDRKNIGKVILSPEKEPLPEPEDEKKKKKKKDKKEDKKKEEDKEEKKEEAKADEAKAEEAKEGEEAKEDKAEEKKEENEAKEEEAKKEDEAPKEEEAKTEEKPAEAAAEEGEKKEKTEE